MSNESGSGHARLGRRVVLMVLSARPWSSQGGLWLKASAVRGLPSLGTRPFAAVKGLVPRLGAAIALMVTHRAKGSVESDEDTCTRYAYA